jgi:hypothetical protein
MIRLAGNDDTPEIRRMWKTCFDDSDEYMNLYFSLKYKPENTLVYIKNNFPAASLQMLPCFMRFYGETLPATNITGAST